MFVILKSGGKQYRVSEGNKIDVEKLNLKEGERVVLDDILFLQRDDGNVSIGKPTLDNVKVEAEIISNYKDDKVLIFKKRRRKNSKRLNGHRQQKTALKILNINVL
jgi:large subunit ribosomal protein L21